MIALNSASRPHGHGWQTAVLVCATVAVCAGVVPAQDYGAVGRRLKSAVQHGEITQQQADTMMVALKNTAATNQDLAKAQAYRPTVKKRLATAVEAGTTSKEHAIRKNEAAKGDTRTAAQDPSHADPDAVRKKQRAQAQAGKITEEQAVVKRSAVKKAASYRPGELAKAQADRAGVKKKPATAVEAGKTTKEDAIRKDEAAKRDMKKMAGRDPSHAGLDAVQKRLKTEVQAGKMTKDEAMARRKAIKGQLRE